MNVLVHCEDVVGASMAGPGIRYWEISAQLAQGHAVTLSTPFQTTLEPTEFSLVKRSLRPHVGHYRGYQAVLTQRVLPHLAMAKRRFGFRLIVDLYDPVILENLELVAGLPASEQRRTLSRIRRELVLALRTGDHFVCASEIQRDMWIGSLTTADRITPQLYAADPTLRGLIDVVPFGVGGRARAKTGPGLRERFQLREDDFVILWGGGIWNWLDPLTLIESVAQLVPTAPECKLVFMGLEHPNERIPEMAMSVRARRLAQELGLAGNHVLFNDGWVPYEDRHNMLLDADVGVSIHADHLETHFAFRTRNLDYLWAGLPIISTGGDFFADLLESSGAGIAVPPFDREALIAAIASLRDEQLRARMSRASSSLGDRYAWSRVVRPLETMLHARGDVVRPSPGNLTHAMSWWYWSAALRRIRKLLRAEP